MSDKPSSLKIPLSPSPMNNALLMVGYRRRKVVAADVRRRICFIPLTSASSCRRLRLSVPLLLALTFFLSPAGAVTFSTNSYIGISDSSFDSQDIEVTNCTVTIDGPHSFSSLHIQNGGIVTHSFSSNGFLLNPIHVANEVQVLSDTNPPTLNHPNVVTDSVVISDTNLVTYYTQAVDYIV